MIGTIAPFLAGLGLFFCGVHFIAANVTPLVGRRLRAVLMRVSQRPTLAAISGIVAGMITQSANAVAFIALTAHALVEDREKAKAAGCDDFDTKPVELPHPLDKISRLLEQRAAG